MRWNRKFVAYMLAINLSGAGLLMVLSNSAWTQEAKKTNAKIKELQQERLALLEKASTVANNLFRNARVAYEDFLQAEREHLAARLEYAETREERIKACDQAIEAATQSVDVVKQQRDNVRGTELSVMKAKAYLLEIKITREKLEAGN